MDVKTIVKWGVVVIAGWFLLRWLSGFFDGGPVNLGGGTVYPNYYAAPLVTPASPVFGPVAPWAVYYGGGRRRGRR
jgi:hypothetical protein